MYHEILVFCIKDIDRCRIVNITTFAGKTPKHVVTVSSGANNEDIVLRDGNIISLDLNLFRCFLKDNKYKININILSLFYNELFLSLWMAYVVPVNIVEVFSKCSCYITNKLDNIKYRICKDGINKGLNTDEILIYFENKKNNTEIVLNEKFIECTRIALNFINSTFYMDQPDEQIMPYCLIPLPHYSTR